MTDINHLDKFQLFGLSGIRIERDLQKIQEQYEIDLGKEDQSSISAEEYLEDFPERLRIKSYEMSKYYRIFYCLENSVRQLIIGKLSEQVGEDWWDQCAPEAVRNNATQSKQRELEQGFTPRSELPIDYSNFGELAEIIKKNWPYFEDTLKNPQAVQRILGTLNRLRGPIAHCNALAEDEVGRLLLALKDWARQLS